MSEQQLQIWVRNDKGQVYGPLSPPSVELLIDNGIIGGRLQVSTNGEHYMYPGRVPGLRVIFPKETWGDVVVPGEELDAEWSKVAVPAAIGGAAPTSTPSGVMPGPPVSAGPMAGPGVRQTTTRAAPAVRPTLAQARAAGTVGKAPTNPSPIFGTESAVQLAPSTPSAIRSGPSVMDFMTTAPTGTVKGASLSDLPPSVVAPPAPAAPVPATAPRSSGSGLRAAVKPVAVEGELTMPASGTIGAPSVPALYYIAAATEQTGVLTVQMADREITVHFRKGNPEHLDSTHHDDSLDTFLMQQRLATAEQIAQAQAAAPSFGGELLPALFGLGLLNPNAVFQHLGQRALGLLFRALTAEQGTFAFDLEELPASRAMPLGNKWAVYLDALRRVPGHDLRRRLSTAMDLPIMKASGRVAATDVRLTPQETRAYNQFDGARSLNQLIADLPQDADTMVRVAWMLWSLDLVSFAGVAARQGTPPGSRAVPRSPPAGTPAAAPVAPVAPAPAAPRPAAAVPVMTPAVPVAPAPAAPRPAAMPPVPVMTPAVPVAPAAPGVPVAVAPPGAPPMGARPPPVMTPAVPVAPAAPGGPVAVAPPGAPPMGARPPSVVAPAAPRPPPVMAPAAAPAFPGGAPAAPRPPPVMAPSSSPSMAAKPPVTSSPSRAPSSSPSGLSAPPSDDVAALQKLHEQMKGQNFFEVLGVKREADANQVKIAYLKAARSYHPDTVPPGSPEALAKVKADIFALIGEANRTLSDAKLRADYTAELDAGGTGNKVDIEKLLRAEELFQKGRVLVQARKYPDALKFFEDAITHNPDEAEFYAWRGWSRYLSASDRKAAIVDATKDMKACLARNPNVAAVHYFMGVFAKQNGDATAATRYFKECVRLDPRHIDAARELRAK